MAFPSFSSFFSVQGKGETGDEEILGFGSLRDGDVCIRAPPKIEGACWVLKFVILQLRSTAGFFVVSFYERKSLFFGECCTLWILWSNMPSCLFACGPLSVFAVLPVWEDSIQFPIHTECSELGFGLRDDWIGVLTPCGVSSLVAKARWNVIGCISFILQ